MARAKRSQTSARRFRAGPPATCTSTTRPRAREGSAGDEAGELGEPGAQPQAPERLRPGGGEDPLDEPPDLVLVGRRVAVGLARELAVELDPVAAVAVDHVLDRDPPVSLLPADLEHRPEDLVAGLLGLPISAFANPGQFSPGGARAETRRVPPARHTGETIVLLIRNCNLGFLIRNPHPGYPS